MGAVSHLGMLSAASYQTPLSDLSAYRGRFCFIVLHSVLFFFFFFSKLKARPSTSKDIMTFFIAILAVTLLDGLVLNPQRL